MAKKMGVSPITNTIYYGNINEEKHMWTGQKTDVTDMAVGAVFEWFMGNMKDNECYEIRYKGIPYVLRMCKEDKKN